MIMYLHTGKVWLQNITYNYDLQNSFFGSSLRIFSRKAGEYQARDNNVTVDVLQFNETLMISMIFFFKQMNEKWRTHQMYLLIMHVIETCTSNETIAK